MDIILIRRSVRQEPPLNDLDSVILVVIADPTTGDTSADLQGEFHQGRLERDRQIEMNQPNNQTDSLTQAIIIISKCGYLVCHAMPCKMDSRRWVRIET